MKALSIKLLEGMAKDFPNDKELGKAIRRMLNSQDFSYAGNLKKNNPPTSLDK